MSNRIINEIKESIKVKSDIIKDPSLLIMIESLANEILKSIKNGGKIIFCGNGGSFADSQHLAAEFVSRLRFDRPPLPSLALGTNSSNVTAVANDYGYEEVFSREIISIGKETDIFIPISTSGNSLNILKAIKSAKDKKIKVIGLSGKDGGKMKDICDLILVPSNSTEKIQESHIMIGHIVCSIVEYEYFSNK
ncbi:D-sedoheptulose 7-phosphate isomerase [Flavobacteriaceae bacterium]|nr:D-sedoheptulose 7-phosphate isomerase [Flavobacteriaceae bacterium]